MYPFIPACQALKSLRSSLTYSLHGLIHGVSVTNHEGANITPRRFSLIVYWVYSQSGFKQSPSLAAVPSVAQYVVGELEQYSFADAHLNVPLNPAWR